MVTFKHTCRYDYHVINNTHTNKTLDGEERQTENRVEITPSQFVQLQLEFILFDLLDAECKQEITILILYTENVSFTHELCLNYFTT